MNWIKLKKNGQKWTADNSLTFGETLADRMSNWVGSWNCVFYHIIWFIVWIVINTNPAWIKPFDPYPFNFLTLIVSLEAIFLTMFILIAQNRQSYQDRLHVMMDLEINKRSEKDIQEIKFMLLKITESQEKIVEELEDDSDN